MRRRTTSERVCRQLGAAAVTVAVGAITLVTVGCGDVGSNDGPRTMVVAAKAVPAYVTGADAQRLGLFEMREVPADVVPDDPVTNLDEVRCQVTIAPLARGTAVSKAMFAEPSSVNVTLPAGIEGCS